MLMALVLVIVHGQVLRVSLPMLAEPRIRYDTLIVSQVAPEHTLYSETLGLHREVGLVVVWNALWWTLDVYAPGVLTAFAVFAGHVLGVLALGRLWNVGRLWLRYQEHVLMEEARRMAATQRAADEEARHAFRNV